MTTQERAHYAQIGAAARLKEIDTERAAILRDFPGLRANDRKATTTMPTRRPPMKEAERRAVSLRMKKYWAERRKAKAAAAK